MINSEIETVALLRIHQLTYFTKIKKTNTIMYCVCSNNLFVLIT